MRAAMDVNTDGRINKFIDNAQFKLWSNQESKSGRNRHEVRDSTLGRARWIRNAIQKR
jgi:hypothetical protein